MIVDPEIEGVAIYDLNGELLDWVGKVPRTDWVKEVAMLMSMIGASIGDKVQSVEIDLGNRKLCIVIDPPLIRVGVIRKRR